MKRSEPTQADIYGHGNDMWPEAKASSIKQLTKFSGKVVREGAEVIIIFKVQGKYYPATVHNSDVMDTYIHTGDKALLNQFENEVEF